MSTRIININNDHDNDPPLPPHLNSDDDDNNGRYPEHHDHPYHQQHRQQQKGSRRDTSRALRYVFFFVFLFSNTLLTNIYTLDCLPPPNGCHVTYAVTWQPYPTQSTCEGRIGWRNGRGKGWGSRRDSSRAPGMFFFLFVWNILIVSCI